MKIGVFDSGLGGLIIMRAIAERLPQYDFAYFGDTANLPYGSRSPDIIYKNSVRAMDYLFGVADCAIVIVACNTASAVALRRLQNEYLPATYPDPPLLRDGVARRRILGVVVPTIEAVAARGFDRVGLVATTSTVNSHVYDQELAKVCATSVISVATPLIVSLVENGGDKYAREIIGDYLERFAGTGIRALILGCTHYPFYKDIFAELVGGVVGAYGIRPGRDVSGRMPYAPTQIPIISQDEIIPESLADYLSRHPEIDAWLTKNSVVGANGIVGAYGIRPGISRPGRMPYAPTNGERIFAVSDLNDGYIAQARRIFGEELELTQVKLPD